MFTLPPPKLEPQNRHISPRRTAPNTKTPRAAEPLAPTPFSYTPRKNEPLARAPPHRQPHAALASPLGPSSVRARLTLIPVSKTVSTPQPYHATPHATHAGPPPRTPDHTSSHIRPSHIPKHTAREQASATLCLSVNRTMTPEKLKEKLRKKLHRDPTPAEIQHALNERKAKKKRERDQPPPEQSAPETSAPAPAPAPAPPPPPAPAPAQKKPAKPAKPPPTTPAAAASSSSTPAPPTSGGGGNALLSGRKRKAPASTRKVDPDAIVVNAATRALDVCAKEVAVAAAHLTKAARVGFSDIESSWEQLTNGAHAFAAAIDAALGSGHQDTKRRLKARLAPALESVADVRARVEAANAAIEAAKAEKAAARRANSTPRPFKVDEAVRDDALERLKKHHYDVMLAADGKRDGSDGTLTLGHLKQLCIYKGLYSTADGAPSQLKMVSWLMAPEVFKAERRAAK